MAGRRRRKNNSSGGAVVLGLLLFGWIGSNWRSVGWLVVVLAVAAVALGVLVAVQRAWRERPLVEIDRMSGGEFESYLHGMFRKLGYGVTHTGRSGDYGCDLVVTDAGGKGRRPGQAVRKTPGPATDPAGGCGDGHVRRVPLHGGHE